MVQENYAALVGGMRQVQAVDLDLARAGVQVIGLRKEGGHFLRTKACSTALSTSQAHTAPRALS